LVCVMLVMTGCGNVCAGAALEADARAPAGDPVGSPVRTHNYTHTKRGNDQAAAASGVNVNSQRTKPRRSFM
jgi:hypothetical protein